MTDPSRPLFTLGLGMLVAGIILMGLSRLHLPLGRLPGDLTWRSGSGFIYLPVASCVLVSLLLSVLVWVLNRLNH